MEDVVNKMFDESPNGLFGDNVFLAAFLAITPGYRCSAIKAVLFNTFWLVGHANFFLKIGTKNAVRTIYGVFTKTIFYF